MKTNINVTVDFEALKEAKARRLNISGICNTALIDTVGITEGSKEKQQESDNKLISKLADERKSNTKAYIYALFSFSKNNNGLIPNALKRREHGEELLKYIEHWKIKHKKVSPAPPSKKRKKNARV